MALTQFRLGELERKMQQAASNLDYEGAIILRGQLRAERLAIEDAPKTPQPKIVDIFTRDAFIGGSEESEEPKYIDMDAVGLLKAALVQVEAGSVIGVCLLKGLVDKAGYLSDVVADISVEALDNYLLFVGAATELGHQMIEIEYDAFQEESDEEE
jgi:hypothetical protein